MVNYRLASNEKAARWPMYALLVLGSLLLFWFTAGAWRGTAAPAPAGLSPAQAGAALAAPAASPTVPVTCTTNWLTIESPNVLSRTNNLRAISSGPDNDLWAVGTFTVADTQFTLTEHWDGTQWQQVASPNPGTTSNRLGAVARIAANDVWAVGSQSTLSSYGALALHWDGAQWTTVPLPNNGASRHLTAVSGVAANDVWAVGDELGVSTTDTWILHWNGSQWSEVAGSNPSPFTNTLSAVAARTANDVWAVGYSYNGFGDDNMLIEHWNGTAWSLVPSPATGQLTSVVAIAANDVWAGGGSSFSSFALHWDGLTWSSVFVPSTTAVTALVARAANDIWGAAGNVILHWNGQNWQSDPVSGPDGSSFQGVAVTPGATWIVGDYDQNGDVRQALALHRTATTWSQVATPFVTFGVRGTELSAVAAVASNDVWAVGSYDATRSGTSYTLAQHWDGSAWRIVDIPSILYGYQRLEGVTAISTNDVWAVGLWEDGTLADPPAAHPAPSSGAAAPRDQAPAKAPASGPQQPAMDQLVIEHWDGTHWQLVPGPTLGATYQNLTAVSGVAANDVWAVGYTDDGWNSGQPLLIHWDGTAWTLVPAPSTGAPRNFLYAVSARAANDVWAVGQTLNGSEYHALILHWDGTQWSVVPPTALGVGSTLRGVVAGASGDAWAVGSITSSAGAPAQTLTLYWNGTTWSQVASPSVAGSDNLLNSVTWLASGEAWTVGIVGDYSSAQTLTLHWDGSTWTPVPTSTVGGAGARLLGVTALTPNDVWTVGAAYPLIYAPQTLIEHYGNVLPFSDVPSSNPFYSYIRCLSCRGLVSGYPDGTFRPNNTTTRGQAAKFVANAAGYSDPITPTQQTFNDVPTNQPFWLYVERVAAHNVIEGYPCGGPGEPCPGRYFRPSTSVTRAQMSKFIAESAGYTDPIPSTQQTFADVPPSDALWLYVERVYAHAIISGYPCGGVGEPCPGRYFRPTNPLTRGQATKFIAGVFFPSCAVPPTQ